MSTFTRKLFLRDNSDLKDESTRLETSRSIKRDVRQDFFIDDIDSEICFSESDKENQSPAASKIAVPAILQ